MRPGPGTHGVVDRGGHLAEAGGDQPYLARVLADVAGGVHARHRRRPWWCRPRCAASARSRRPQSSSGPRLAMKPSAATSRSHGSVCGSPADVDLDLGHRVAEHRGDLGVGDRSGPRTRCSTSTECGWARNGRPAVHQGHRLGDRFQQQRPVHRRVAAADDHHVQAGVLAAGRARSAPRRGPSSSSPVGSGRGVNVPMPPVTMIARARTRWPVEVVTDEARRRRAPGRRPAGRAGSRGRTGPPARPGWPPARGRGWPGSRPRRRSPSPGTSR